MNIYTISFLLCFLFAFIELIINNNTQKSRLINRFNLFFSIVIMFFIAGFREVGYDYNSYKGIYNAIGGSNWFIKGSVHGMEPGFALLNHLSSSYQILLATMSLLCLVLLFNVLIRYSKLPILSLLIYWGVFFLSGVMGQQRQALAVIISIYAIINVDNKRIFYPVIFIAMMFHMSAILVLAAKFIPKDYKPLKYYVISYIGAIIMNMIAHKAYLVVINYFPPFMANKLMIYAEKETTSLGLNSAVLLRTIFFCLYYNFRDRLRQIPYLPHLLNCYFLSLLIYIGFGFAPQVAGRGGVYFAALEVIISANLVYVLKGRTKLVILFMILAISAFRLIRFINDPAQSSYNVDYLPYQNWLL